MNRVIRMLDFTVLCCIVIAAGCFGAVLALHFCISQIRSGSIPLDGVVYTCEAPK